LKIQHGVAVEEPNIWLLNKSFGGLVPSLFVINKRLAFLGVSRFLNWCICNIAYTIANYCKITSSDETSRLSACMPCGILVNTVDSMARSELPNTTSDRAGARNQALINFHIAQQQ
jgi:hypothetical protein